MKPTKPPRFLTTVSLVVWLLAFGIGPRAVLCVGPNGHSAIESIDAMCCVVAPVADSSVGVWAAHYVCDDACVDSALGTGTPLQRGGRYRDSAPTAGALPLLVQHALLHSSDIQIQAVAANCFHWPPGNPRSNVRLC